MTATQVWVRSNRRVLGLAMVVPAAFTAVGAGILGAAEWELARGFAWLLVAVGVVMIVGLAFQFIRARVAYGAGSVLFYLRPGPPIAVPVAAVEAFFLGQGPAHLPGDRGGRLEATNLVARISQKYPEWEHVPVKPALGRWCEHYVTISGPWCERLDGELIERLNYQLRLAHQSSAPAPPAAGAKP